MITLTIKMQFNEESDARAAQDKILSTMFNGLVTFTEVSLSQKVAK